MICVEGEKLFTLVPPCDAAWLDEQSYMKGRYQREADLSFSVQLDPARAQVCPRRLLYLLEYTDSTHVSSHLIL